MFQILKKLLTKNISSLKINKNRRSKYFEGVKKMKIKNKTKRKISICFFIIILCSIAFFTGKTYGFSGEKNDTKVIVQSGDTLWNIAKEYGSKGNVRANVEKIMKKNNLTRCDIQAGDELIIPSDI